MKKAGATWRTITDLQNDIVDDVSVVSNAKQEVFNIIATLKNNAVNFILFILFPPSYLNILYYTSEKK